MAESTTERRQAAQQLIESLSAVARVDDDVYEAFAPSWFGPRLFGGHVVALSVVAAMHSTGSRQPPHSLHGYFLRPVTPNASVRLTVDHLRDGRAFTARQVRLAQDGEAKFVGMCSFHADEPGADYQPRMPSVVPPQDTEEDRRNGPVECRALPPTPRRDDGTYQSTRRSWLRLLAPLPSDPTVAAAIAAYVSDMTGNAFRPLSLDRWDGFTDASLDHAVWFHRPIRLDEWALFDLQCAVNHAGRSLLTGALYDAAGRLCLSMAQELLIRPLGGAAGGAP